MLVPQRNQCKPLASGQVKRRPTPTRGGGNMPPRLGVIPLSTRPVPVWGRGAHGSTSRDAHRAGILLAILIG
jgi:hypothetical protein